MVERLGEVYAPQDRRQTVPRSPSLKAGEAQQEVGGPMACPGAEPEALHRLGEVGAQAHPAHAVQALPDDGVDCGWAVVADGHRGGAWGPWPAPPGRGASAPKEAPTSSGGPR
jgi:hypothetical protein